MGQSIGTVDGFLESEQPGERRPVGGHPSVVEPALDDVEGLARDAKAHLGDHEADAHRSGGDVDEGFAEIHASQCMAGSHQGTLGVTHRNLTALAQRHVTRMGGH